MYMYTVLNIRARQDQDRNRLEQDQWSMAAVDRALLCVGQTYLLMINYCINNLIKAAHLYI